MLHKRELTITFVFPVFNEQETLPELFDRLKILSKKYMKRFFFEFIFVNDGSSDHSLDILLNHKTILENKRNKIRVVDFSRNFGHQIAITAGLDYSTGDYVAVIDADLQDPPELVIDMLELAITGYDVVYARRTGRKGESYFKKISAKFFYRLINKLCEVEIPADTGDFRLMSKAFVKELVLLRERHRFVRGLVPWLGFKAIELKFERDKRFAGVTKYPLSKMINFATNAIVSFSVKPLRVAIQLGLFISIAAFIGIFYIICLKIFTDSVIPGFAALMVSVSFLGGVQLLFLGLLGEYIGKIFEEVKGRPLYVIQDIFESE